MKLHQSRRHYQLAELTESEAGSNPHLLFHKWFEDARNSEVLEPNAMVLATANASGKPAARVVLLKEFSEAGFVFFTNYESAKGRALAENPQAELLFFWDVLERQVRIEGKVEKISEAASEKYFFERPVQSQYGAMASHQSAEIPSREYLEQQLIAIQANAPHRPEYWGGYIVIPDRFEFWQGRPSRLHDRLSFTLINSEWKRARLSP
ncbi:MAG: pyridoxamine 5'-phosphate oxidase [Chitinophagales bacterium]